jgi:hypothetical protein
MIPALARRNAASAKQNQCRNRTVIAVKGTHFGYKAMNRVKMPAP